MSRTIRRRHYTPAHIQSDFNYLIDPATGWEFWGGYRRLEGDELKRSLLAWHRDGSGLWEHRYPKSYRHTDEEKLRSLTKREFARFHKDPAYEVQCLRQLPQDWYD